MPDAPRWYVEKREEVAQVFQRASVVSVETHGSPSGRYRLEVARLSTGPNTWEYSRGRVLALPEGRLLSQVDRNYGAFPFSWCEVHPSGHAFLVCGEDYQGQTVIELDTGRRVDFVPPGTREGVAFCWAAHYPSPDGSLLFVDGCVWACPYELVLYDFSRPMELPYRELRRWPVWEVRGFQSDGSFVFEYPVEVRRSDDKPVSGLSDEEQRQLDEAPRYDDVVREKKYRVTWHPDMREDVVALD